MLRIEMSSFRSRRCSSGVLRRVSVSQMKDRKERRGGLDHGLGSVWQSGKGSTLTPWWWTCFPVDSLFILADNGASILKTRFAS
jgi:hypothetical protein